LIIGTAGHVDHGKTSLVRALTGVETDRLQEEKERGISIELGYAYQQMPNGEILGFVDVPGHERFIHTMLAGATGIDFALLVVGADDGIMPQTVEHLHILELLGVARGAVALTKIDRVDAQRIAQVSHDIERLLEGTGLSGSGVFPVSATTGAGVDDLREHLVIAAAATRGRPVQGHFRLAVDRSFTLTGAGTVVTGTVFAGEVTVGDRLVVTPAAIPVRVRSIHSHNRPAATGSAGQRCALNIVGAGKDEILRGDWIVAEAIHAPTARFDVRLRLLPEAPRALGVWTPVHVHLGATHVTGRCVPLDADWVAPGAQALAQIVLDRAIGALHGDRLILRDASARQTIGGGMVIDPFAPARHRRAPLRLAALQCLEQTDHTMALSNLLQREPYGVDLGAFCRARNLAAPDCILAPSALRVGEPSTAFAFDLSRWEALQTRVLEGLEWFHAKFEDELGPDSARLRRMLLPQLAPAAAKALVDQLLAEQQIVRSGPWLHLPKRGFGLDTAEQELASRVLPLIEAGGFDPPWVRDLAGRVGADEQLLRRLLLRLTRRGETFQVVRDLFYAKGAVAALAQIAAELEERDGAVRAAAFRDSSKLGRKRTVQILEFFDRIGYTRRSHDVHRVRSNSLLQIANARPAEDTAVQP